MSRVSGVDRYATAAAVSAEGFSSSAWAVVATGSNFPDALVASALIGKRGGVLLLTDFSGSSVANEVRSHAPSISRVYVLGGTAAVPASVVEWIFAALS